MRGPDDATVDGLNPDLLPMWTLTRLPLTDRLALPRETSGQDTRSLAPWTEVHGYDSRSKVTTDVEEYFAGGNLLPCIGRDGYSLTVVLELLAVGRSGGARVPKACAGAATACWR